MRKLLVLIHRYAGLAMTSFLVVVGATGATLAFQREIDAALNPRSSRVTRPGAAAPLDPFTLADRALSLDPRLEIDGVELWREPDAAASVSVSGRTDPATGKAYDVGFDRVLVDPYSGEVLGTRSWKASPLSRDGFVPFVFRLHYALLTETVGGYVLGGVAALWTLDCFIGFYLTLPRRRRTSPEHAAPAPAGRPGRSWWASWARAWKVRRRLLSFDLHRAGGLWLWPMLFVLAWSSVAFNLADQVYRPIMSRLFGMNAVAELPHRARPLETPRLDYRAARTVGRELLDATAARQGLRVQREEMITFDRERGLYCLMARSDRDRGRWAETSVIFDAETGQLVRADSPATAKLGDRITAWLFYLHTASVAGRPMQVVVSVTGIGIVVLSITGVIVWWRRLRRDRRRRGKAREQVREEA